MSHGYIDLAFWFGYGFSGARGVGAMGTRKGAKRRGERNTIFNYYHSSHYRYFFLSVSGRTTTTTITNSNSGTTISATITHCY